MHYQTVFPYVISAPSDWLRREPRHQRGGSSALFNVHGLLSPRTLISQFRLRDREEIC